MLVCAGALCSPPGDAREGAGGWVRALQQIDTLLERRYVTAERAGTFAAAFHRLWASGVYDTVTTPQGFAARVTADLRAITGDSHTLVRVVQSSDAGEKAAGPLHHPIRYYRMRLRENTGYSSVRWLEGNIGYLDLRRFNAFSEAREMARSAVRLLSGADAIIIDVRENRGGSGDYLSSFFLRHPTQLTGSYSRQDDFLRESWTLADPGAPRLTEVPLLVLTGRHTFSAAESFAFDLQQRRRARLVGEPTGGGAHSVDLFQLEGGFEMYLSTERAVSPITGGNWEGTGVIPDVAVPAAAAYDSALTLAREAAREFAQRKEERLKPAIAAMEAWMDEAETHLRAGRLSSGEAALDSMVSIGEPFGMVTEFFMGVLAYNFTGPGDEAVLTAILRKSVALFPQSATARETLAYAYYKSGEAERAVECYRQMLTLDPGNGNALRMMEKIEREKMRR
jgi:tetratricopeptide (TPR) repeat protein